VPINARTRSVHAQSFRRFGIVAAALLALTPFVSPPAVAVEQCGRICTLTTYYSTSAKTKVVGQYSDCPGGVKKGSITPYFKILSVATGICGNTTTEAPPTCELIDGVLACTRHPLR
jgi:hypothetical protein